jgi:hypothetical protein
MSAFRHIWYDWTIQAEKLYYETLKCSVTQLGWLTRDPNCPHLKYRVETLSSYFVLSKRLEAFICQKNFSYPSPRFCFKQYPQTIKEPYVFETN